MPASAVLFKHPHPEVEQVYRRVIGLRRRNPWLVDAVVRPSRWRTGTSSYVPRPARGRVLTLALNLTGKPFALAAGAGVLEAEPASRGAVAPHGWVVFNP